jgi:ABC-type glycerol-3-phosphate transport system substrate-binding protein
MRAHAVLFALALILTPIGVKAADLMVWWDEGFYPEEAKAVREIVGAFEQETGKQVEVRFHPEGEHADAIEAALGAGQPPDFAFGIAISSFISKWCGRRLSTTSRPMASGPSRRSTRRSRGSSRS